ERNVEPAGALDDDRPPRGNPDVELRLSPFPLRRDSGSDGIAKPVQHVRAELLRIVAAAALVRLQREWLVEQRDQRRGHLGLPDAGVGAGDEEPHPQTSAMDSRTTRV